MHRSRPIDLDKTRLQHIGTAAAINVVRVVTWLDGDELVNWLPHVCLSSSSFTMLLKGVSQQ